MNLNTWMRVIDPLSPLFGCDVYVWNDDGCISDDGVWYIVKGIRRIDITVGDRPYQMIGELADNFGLGIRVHKKTLAESAIQDSVIEFSKDKFTLYGDFVDESLYVGEDEIRLVAVRFTKAIQAALHDANGTLVASNTWYSDDPVELTLVEGSLCNMLGADIDALIVSLKTGKIENG